MDINVLRRGVPKRLKIVSMAQLDKPRLLYFGLCGTYREEVSEKKKCQQTIVERDLLKYVQVMLKLVFRFVIIYYFLWLCSPARAMASCGSAAQCGLWPPVALQPSASYGLL
jgi:hypothetical protein